MHSEQAHFGSLAPVGVKQLVYLLINFVIQLRRTIQWSAHA